MAEYRSRAIVRVDHLSACALFQSTEETRYYLQGTQIAPHASGKGAELVATDGKALLAIYDAEAHAEGLPAVWSVPKAKVKPAITAWLKAGGSWNKKSKLPYWCDLALDDGGGISMSIYCAQTAKDVLEIGPADSFSRLVTMTRDKTLIIDGSFPDWRRVTPNLGGHQPKPVAPQPLAAPYLKLVGEMAMLLSNGQTTSPALAIHPTSDGGPMRVVVAEHPEVVCVVMPMRAECPAVDPGWLHWTEPAAKPEKRAKAA